MNLTGSIPTPPHCSLSSLCCVVFTLLAACGPAAGQPAKDALYNSQIRPILARHCWRCHGPDSDNRQAGLRLDQFSSATAVQPSGLPAIHPGQPEQSPLLQRVTSTDPQLRMPPPEAGDPLTASETALLREWIRAGATYEQHWAFQPLLRPDIPQPAGLFPEWAENPIDAFVAATLQQQHLQPAVRADQDTLIRRVWFDLIGMPPVAAEADQAREQTWEQVVEQLLESPHFGERMAVEWLDMARYADTDGYFGDKPRQIWPYRDWLINAFNRNLPYDQFTVEQLAGDLLPNATNEQRTATGFNRNHMSNDETGLIDEEFRVEYVADRTDTTMAVWLGLTAGCARCHDHKYDPMSQREYYQLFAFFNNVPEQGLLVGSNAPPVLSVPTPAQQRQLPRLTAAAQVARTAWEPLHQQAQDAIAERTLATTDVPEVPSLPGQIFAALDSADDVTVSAVGTTVQHSRGIVGNAAKFDGTQHLQHPAEDFPVDGPWTASVWLQPQKSLNGIFGKIEPTGSRRGVEVIWRKGRVLVNLVHRWNESAIEVSGREKLPPSGWQHLAVRYDGSATARGVSIFLNGRQVPVEILRDSLDGSVATAEPLRIGRRDEGLGYYGLLDQFRWLPAALSDAQLSEWSRTERLRGILERSVTDRTTAEKAWLVDDYIAREGSVKMRAAQALVRSAERALTTLKDQIPQTLVMAERSADEGRRPTYLLERGEYQRPGEQVEPGVPQMLGGWNSAEPADRLGLARWLMTGASQLTARVAVNRLWQQCFGAGLVRTPADFGTQGMPPTHPELLDWLACEYRDSGWDTKRLLKLIVTSQTYQQSSAMRTGTEPSSELSDPENYWLSRGGRFRLTHEMLRDARLRVSGLLQTKLGGPSVKPYQPPGLWEEVSYDGESSWETDSGAGQFRRSLYTFHKRQAPPPGLLLFDGPTREKCTLQRARTNTPLQALQLLNDPEILQAARHVAAEVLAAADTETRSGRTSHAALQDDRIERVFRMLLTRAPDATERRAISTKLSEWQTLYESDREATAALLASSRLEDSPPLLNDSAAAKGELAAWTILVQSLFSLDEAVNRR